MQVSAVFFLLSHIFKVLQFNQPTNCPLDLIASHLLQLIPSTLLPALTINTSLLTMFSSPHSNRLKNLYLTQTSAKLQASSHSRQL